MSIQRNGDRYSSYLLVLLVVVSSGCTVFQEGVSRCVYGPAQLALNVGVGPSTSMFMIKLDEGGVYTAVAPERTTSPCPPRPAQVH